MRVGMIQPNYVPWRGYFDFVASVDLFIFYDDVALGMGRKWRNRNRIQTAHGTRWLTVPIRGGQSDVLLHAVEIAQTPDWSRRHGDLIRAAYGKTMFLDRVEKFEEILSRPWRLLADLDIALARWLMSEFGIATATCRSSDLGLAAGDKRTRPLEILEHVDATTYVIGPAAVPYTDIGEFARRGIRLEVKSYDYRPYPQFWPGFEAYVSALDLLLAEGPAAREHLVSRSPNLVLSE